MVVLVAIDYKRRRALPQRFIARVTLEEFRRIVRLADGARWFLNNGYAAFYAVHEGKHRKCQVAQVLDFLAQQEEHLAGELDHLPTTAYGRITPKDKDRLNLFPENRQRCGVRNGWRKTLAMTGKWVVNRQSELLGKRGPVGTRPRRKPWRSRLASARFGGARKRRVVAR